jgi:hypothetical protein
MIAPSSTSDQPENPRASREPARGPRFARRFATVYSLLSGAVVGFAVMSGRWDVLAADRQLVLVGLIYWFVPILALRLIVEWRRLWKKAMMAAVLTTVVTVSILEIAGCIFWPERTYLTLREAGLASRRFHHVLPPNKQLISDTLNRGRIVIETNEDGLRTHHDRGEFRRLDLRVVMLGDSYVFSETLPAEKGIPGRLEDMLSAAVPDRSVGVLGAGLMSYSPVIERQVLADVAVHYQPQVTIVCLDVTDIGDDHKYTNESTGPPGDLHFSYPRFLTEPSPRPWLDPMTLQVLRASRLGYPFEWLFSGGGEGWTGPAGRRHKYYKFEVRIGDTLERNRFFILRHPIDDTRVYFENTFAHLQAMRDLCRRSGSKFFLVLLPRPFHWSREEARDDWERLNGYYTGEEPHRNVFLEFFEERGRQEGMNVLNLQPVFQASGVFPLCFANDAHYNENGCQVAAAGILEYLRKHGFVE